MICTTRDEYIQSIEEDQTLWIATLNDGTTVYQDDGRHILSAWSRLKEYCEENNVYITGLKIKFRDHVEHLPSNKDGYYFIKCSECYMGSKPTHNYVVGYIESGQIITIKYRVPEILKMDDGVRDIEKNSNLLIRKK